MRALITRAVLVTILASPVGAPALAVAALTHARPALAAVRPVSRGSDPQPSGDANALEAAAERAGRIGRTVALSLIGLALAAAAVMLVFRRDFKEAIAVFAVGLLAVLLATPTGLRLLQNTAALLFGTQ